MGPAEIVKKSLVGVGLFWWNPESRELPIARNRLEVNVQEAEDSVEEEGGNRSDPAVLLRSYLTFARRVLRERWRASLGIFLAGVVLTVLCSKYLPRTFSCTTVLMAVGNPVLDSRDTANTLTGAENLIMRHENLVTMIKDLNLIKNAESRRPPLLRLKDRIVRSLVGEPSDKIKLASLVGTLETKVTVTAEKGDLEIKAAWTDARTATDLAQAARESFVSARHTAEISAFEEKMSILDGYASKLRVEITDLADQLNAARDQKLNEVRAESESKLKDAVEAKRHAVVAMPVERRKVEPDTQTPALREKLQNLQSKLTAAEAEHDRRVQAEQAKFEEMKLRLTALHPEVITQGQRVEMAQQTPSELALMRAEVASMGTELRVRDAAARDSAGPTGFGSGVARLDARTGADLLPPDINSLLQRDNLDPALTAQLSGTVMKYTALRDELLTTRIALDTAQAAFNHRYQVIVPAEMPTKPDKPNPALIWGAGLFLAILLALGIPVLSELRRGVLSEQWQVENLQLPILAEVHLPPYSAD